MAAFKICPTPTRQRQQQPPEGNHVMTIEIITKTSVSRLRGFIE